MKKLLLVLIIILVFISPSSAKPIISDLSIDPNNLWLGESLTVSLKCVDDNANNTIDSDDVYLNITGPDVFIPSWTMGALENNFYSLTIDDTYLYRTGDYQVNIYCRNNEDQVSSETMNFKISQLTTEITEIDPETAYIGDEIEIDVFVKKDDIELRSGVDFTVRIGDYQESFGQSPPPPYELGKGWILRMDLPEVLGVYDLTVTSKYDRTEASDQSEIEIDQPLRFDLIEISDNWVKKNDNITLTFQASYKGEAMDISENELQIKIGNKDCDIVEISRTATYYYVKIKAPDLSLGDYKLKVVLTYEEEGDVWRKEITDDIKYIFLISGEIIDSENKPVKTEIKFKKGDETTTISTNGEGLYSGEVPAGDYDVEFKFPKSKLILSDVDIEEFDDPIRYDEAGPAVDMTGIGIDEIFVYEVDLTFDGADVELKYDDSKIRNEDNIAVYRCRQWNFGNRLCNGEWKEVDAEIDSVRNYVKFETIELSAFLVGYRKDMLLDANVEEEQYYLNDIIKVLGVVEDEEQKPVKNAKITGKILGTSIVFTTETDSGGVFTKEFQGPGKEGTYDLSLSSEKDPYPEVNQTIELNIIKSEKLSIVVPSSIKIEQGQNITSEIVINNIGQTDFHKLRISIRGIPEYYEISETLISELISGQEKRITVLFEIPEIASVKDYSGNVRVEYDDEILEEMFILNIIKSQETITETQETEGSNSNLPSAKIVIPGFSLEAVLISLFGVGTIGGAFWLRKKKRKPGKGRKETENLLLNIKKEIKKESTENKEEKNEEEYKDQTMYAS